MGKPLSEFPEKIDPQVHVSNADLAVIDRATGVLVVLELTDPQHDLMISVEDAFCYLPHLERLAGNIARAQAIAQHVVTDHMKREGMTKAYVGGQRYKLVQPKGKWEMTEQDKERLFDDLSDLVRDGVIPPADFEAAIAVVTPPPPEPYVNLHHGKLNALEKFGEKVAKVTAAHRRRGPDPAPYIEPDDS